MVPKDSSVWSLVFSGPQSLLSPKNQFTDGLMGPLFTILNNISVTELYFLDLLTLGGYNEATRGILYLQWIFLNKHSLLCLLDQYWVGGEGKRPQLESYLATVGKQMTHTN